MKDAYKIGIRGGEPVDLREQVSALHAAVVLAAKRSQGEAIDCSAGRPDSHADVVNEKAEKGYARVKCKAGQCLHP